MIDAAAKLARASVLGARQGAAGARRAMARSRVFLEAAFDGGFRPDAAENPATSIIVEHLSAGYDSTLAIEDVSGCFGAGSLTAVAGPNGAGKSTLLNVLAGAMRPRSGSLRIESGGSIGFLPQVETIDRDYPVSVMEFAALGSWRSFGAFRTPPYALLNQVLAALCAVGLQDSAETRIRDLSVGQFRRVLFARLIVQNARLILLDEPLAAVDAKTSADLLALIRAWHEEGRTVISVLHDLDQVREIFPSTLLLARRVVAWGSTSEVLDADNLARAGIGDAPAEPRPGLLRLVPS